MDEIVLSREDIVSSILECPNKYSCGNDGIPYVFYKQCVDYVWFPLQIIFLQSLKLGVIPDEWKVSKVVPIHKKGSRLSVENYRPVSLTVVACRILERIIRKHILVYLTTNTLVSKNQHGFLPGRSTLTNFLCFFDHVTATMDAGAIMDAVYLDIAKAFDTIPHDKLLSRLNHLGFRKPFFVGFQIF